MAAMKHWLMKSEPDEFSIDALERVGTEPWSGVRNYQARNYMLKEMKVGDPILFYHSNCAVPGVVGIARVASEPYPDPTQFDPDSDYFDPKTIVVAQDMAFQIEDLAKAWEKALQVHQEALDFGREVIPKHPKQIWNTPKGFVAVLDPFTQIHFSGNRPTGKVDIIEFFQQPQPLFKRNFPMLIDWMQQNEKDGYKTLVFSENSRQIERLTTILADTNAQATFDPVYQGLSAGFVDRDVKIAFATEHQLFDKYYRPKGRQKYSSQTSLTLRELKNLKPGDFVTHIDHGIGRFAGLEKMDVYGVTQEVVRIVYNKLLKETKNLPDNEVALAGFIDVKGMKAQGNQLTKLKVKEVVLTHPIEGSEPWPDEEPLELEIESADEDGEQEDKDEQQARHGVARQQFGRAIQALAAGQHRELVDVGPQQHLGQVSLVVDQQVERPSEIRRRNVGAAVAAHVGRHGPIACGGQSRQLRTPGDPQFRKSVAQQHERAAALGGDLHAQAVDVQRLHRDRGLSHACVLRGGLRSAQTISRRPA